MASECGGRRRAVVLLSGGLDSLIAAHLAAPDYDLQLAITCDYGQRAAVAELATAGHQAARLNIPHQQVNLRWLGRMASNALTDLSKPMPHAGKDSPNSPDHPACTSCHAAQLWVPNRNAVLLMVAAAYAEALECEAVVAGFNREEAALFSDNSPEFVTAANQLLQHSTRQHPSVICPTLHMTKTDMVQLAQRDRIMLDCIYSCYEAGPRHCWRCESCARLKRALLEANCWKSVGSHI
jgi:7-cyano-7-deazaguanine synthase